MWALKKRKREKKRERRHKAALTTPAKAHDEQHLAALPFGSGQALPHRYKTLAGQVWRFCEKQILDALQMRQFGL
jgi:hypothetical protein